MPSRRKGSTIEERDLVRGNVQDRRENEGEGGEEEDCDDERAPACVRTHAREYKSRPRGARESPGREGEGPLLAA